MKNEAPFILLAKRFFESDVVAASRNLESMDENDAVSILKNLPVSMSIEVIKNIDETFAAVLLQKIPGYLFKKIASNLEPEKGMSVLLNLPDDSRNLFLENMEEKKKGQIRELLSYPEDSAGRIMKFKLASFYSDLKIKDAIQKIRKLATKGISASYIYVVNKENRLIGTMSMRDILLAPLNYTLGTCMKKEVFAINCFMDREEISYELSSRRYIEAPVVDSENKLIGVVKADQLLENVQEAAIEGLQKMVGASGDEKAFSPISFSLKTRLPWLHVNLITAFLAASVVALFEDVIAKITMLAIFLPVVAGQGGNAGAQSLAVVMRGLVMREIPHTKAKDLIIKETKIGLINGLIIGLVTGITAWIWKKNFSLGIVIGLGMIINLVVAGFSGAIIPLVMKKINLDPAQCSSIILTTITDVVGFFAFLGLAVLFQSYII